MSGITRDMYMYGGPRVQKSIPDNTPIELNFNEGTWLLGHGRSKVTISQQLPNADAQMLINDSRDRLPPKISNFGTGELIYAGAKGFASSLLNVVGGLVAAPVLKLGEKNQGISDNIATLRNTQRGFDWMGTRPSVLDSTIKVPNGKEKPLVEVLKDQLPGLGSSVTLDEVHQYVKMGERIMLELAQAETNDDTPVTKLNFKVDTLHEKNMTVTVRPGMEVTRAISWYLQAKALYDNQGNREPTLLKEGAMVAKDPDNKLYNFLRSSDLAYGRVSTHMQERSDSYGNGQRASESGFLAMLGVERGQPLQYGIEDFQDRMPSKGGTLLFDKLKSSTPDEEDPSPEIYLKWESSGTPSSSEGQRGDYLDGEFAWNHGVAPLRTFSHGLSFLRNASPEGYRGEKMEKGPARDVLDAFSRAVNRLPLSPDVKSEVISDAEKYGASYMWEKLREMVTTTSNQLSDIDRNNLKKVAVQLNDWAGNMGNYLGIARKGAEVHVKLPTGQDRIVVEPINVKPINVNSEDTASDSF
jgi:hypothetical protein